MNTFKWSAPEAKHPPRSIHALMVRRFGNVLLLLAVVLAITGLDVHEYAAFQGLLIVGFFLSNRRSVAEKEEDHAGMVQRHQRLRCKCGARFIRNATRVLVVLVSCGFIGLVSSSVTGQSYIAWASLAVMIASMLLAAVVVDPSQSLLLRARARDANELPK